MTTSPRLAARRALELLVAGGACTVFAVLTAAHDAPPLGRVFVFAFLLLLAENTAITLPSLAVISPGSMLVMAAISGMAGDGGVLGACIAAVCGGLILQYLRARELGKVLYNCGQFTLATAAAASVYGMAGTTSGLPTLLIGAAAAAVYTALNVCFVLPYIALRHGQPPRRVWTDMRRALPNFLAFGVLGVILGQLTRPESLGLLALPLVLTPAVIARLAYASYLDLKEAHDAAVRVFVRAIDAKDRYTAGHCERVAKYAQYIGEELGLPATRMEHLRYAALMHDVGKLAVPSRLLNKPGRLTEEEYSLIQRHNELCVDILTRVDFLSSTVAIASDRHARYDGGARTGDSRVLEAYIVSVADAFDAMTSTRAYRRALDQDVAFGELRAKSGTQFDPRCAEALIAAVQRRGERYGLGHERDVVVFDVAPPVVGVGSAGLGDLEHSGAAPS